MIGGPSSGGGGRRAGQGRAGAVVGPVPDGRDPVAYDRLRRRVLWALPTGLYLVGSRASLDGSVRANLMTANSVMQVSVAPKLVAVAVDRDALTRRLIDAGRCFTVCLLAREDRAVVRRFVKPVAEVALDAGGRLSALDGEPVTEARTGAPVLLRSPAWLDCAVRESRELGSHVLYLGEVVDAGGPPDGQAMPELLRMEDTRMSYGG